MQLTSGRFATVPLLTTLLVFCSGRVALADGKVFTAAQLKDILELLERLSKFSESIRRHGGDFDQYLQEREKKTGNLPRYLVKVRDGNEEWTTYFPGETEVRAFHEENRDLNLFDDPPADAPIDGLLTEPAPDAPKVKKEKGNI